MTRQSRSVLIGVFFIACAAAPLLAAPADEARARIKSFGELGKAYKALNDSVRGGNGQNPVIAQSVAHIAAAARDQYGWFPATSQPRAGLKTSARLEIWQKPAEFRAAQGAFAAQAEVLQRAAATGDLAAIGEEARKLGATCKSCHTTFRH